MRTRLLPAFLTLCAALAAQPPGFRTETVVAGGINLACSMAFAPDGRLFVPERTTGIIRIVANGQLAGVWATVPCLNSPGSEAGLLAIAVDPDFLRNRHVYVYYARPDFNLVVGRLTEVGGVGVNLTVISPVINGTGRHAGGGLAFGTDGKLYLSTGEGGYLESAQSLASPAGKVLRFNVPDGSVPADNPFAGVPGAAPHIWSYGHRNPFGMTIHPLTGQPYVTENSAFRGDEINRIVRGGNYGWPFHEGRETTPDPACEDPAWVFYPDPAVTGACFYAGALYPPAYVGAMFLADYNRGRITKLDLDASGNLTGETPFRTTPRRAFATRMGPDGNVYVLCNAADAPGGDRIDRLVYDLAPRPSANLLATSNRALGGSVTAGFVARTGDVVVAWLGFSRQAAPIPTPFGDLWILPEILLPAAAVVGDDRTCLGLPVADDPNLRGQRLYLQAAVISGTTVTLTNDAVMILP